MMEGEVARDEPGGSKICFLKPNSGFALGMGGLAYYSVLMARRKPQSVASVFAQIENWVLMELLGEVSEQSCFQVLGAWEGFQRNLRLGKNSNVVDG